MGDGKKESCHLIVYHTVAADGKHLLQGQKRFADIFQILSHLLKTLGHGTSDFRQPSRNLGDFPLQFLNTAPFVLRIRFTFNKEKIQHCLLPEQIPQLLSVDIRLPLLRATVGGDHQNFYFRKRIDATGCWFRLV